MKTPEITHKYLREVLMRTRTIVTVGISLNDVRPSFFVGRYLALRGYRILPVNPAYAGQHAFGSTVHASMADIPQTEDPIKMVDIFRRSEEAGRVVDEALDLFLDRGLETIWMQIGVVDAKAKRRAEKKGVEVIMDLCPKMERQRLWGDLSKGGIVSGIVSSKLMPLE